MKTLATLILLAGLAGNAQACGRYQDDWTGSDKAAHFGVSFAVGVGASRLTTDTWTAFGLALIPGVAKEVLRLPAGLQPFFVEGHGLECRWCLPWRAYR